MSELEALPWAGDILAGRAHSATPGVRVRVLGNTYWGNDDDNGKLGWARYSRGGVTVWVELDDGTSTQFHMENLEVVDPPRAGEGGGG